MTIICTAVRSAKRLGILPAECIQNFLMVFTKYTDYFLQEH